LPAHTSAWRPSGSASGQAFLPPGVTMIHPSVEGTPLPSYRNSATKKPGFFSPHWGDQYLFIADQSNNQIDIFPLMKPNQPQAGTITSGIDGPYGLWYDRQHQSLYVANQVGNTVTVYSHGSVTPSRTYSEDLSRPLYPIVDNQGVLYVGNANNGTVVEYLPGSTHAHQVVQTAGTEADGLALDKHENLYVAYRMSGGTGSIEEFAPGSTQGTVIGMTLDQPQGVIVTDDGTVVATETGSTDRLDVFPAGSSTPSLELPMPQGSVATELAIDCRVKFLYVSGLYSGIVFGVRYPLPGESLFEQDQVSAIIQGTTVTDNLNH
jgi:DNA-binding beta-propeller fold protein YncE